MASKVLACIILDRMTVAIESKIRPEQHDFTPNKSCTDLVNTVRIIIEQSAERNGSLYLAFIDFKAFDRVRRGRLWLALGEISSRIKLSE